MLTAKVNNRPFRLGHEYKVSYVSTCGGYFDIEYFDGSIPYRLQRCTKAQLLQLFEIKGHKN